jgi:hypothetical protein
MIDFEELVNKSLATINTGFEESISDLTKILDSITSALQNASSRNFLLDYRIVSEGPKGSVARVFFDADPDDVDAEQSTITHIWIPAKGYPIEGGTYRKSLERFDQTDIFNDGEALEAYFADLLASPDSALIQAIGFGMRQSAQSGSSSPFE